MNHSTLHAVEAVINFNDPDFDDSVVDDIDRTRSRVKFVAQAVPIVDIRGHESEFSLDRNGFTSVKAPTKCTNFFDEQTVVDVYYPECTEIVKRLTGAALVVPFGHLVRSKRPDAPANARTPAMNAHVDYDSNTARKVAERLAPAEDRERWLRGRYMVINVWRPLAPVQRHPLAVVDGATVRRRNLHPVQLLASRSGVSEPAGYNVSHHPDQRWHYWSQMQPDEALLFRMNDAKPDAVQWVGHTAFDDPETLPDAPERQSIEMRTCAFLPW